VGLKVKFYLKMKKEGARNSKNFCQGKLSPHLTYNLSNDNYLKLSFLYIYADQAYSFAK